MKKIKLKKNEILLKSQQSKITVGRVPCIRRRISSPCVRTTVTYMATSSNPYQEAESYCVSLITATITSGCFYGFFHDGF